MAKMGRPPIIIKDLHIDPITLSENLASIWCTQEEIAKCLGVSIGTVKRAKKVQAEFSAALKRGAEESNCSLQRRAKRLVEAGNVVMTIFALKNKCGWTDRREVKTEGEAPSITVVNTPQAAQQDKPQAVPAMHIDAAGSVEVHDD